MSVKMLSLGRGEGGIKGVDRTFGVCVFRGSSCEILRQFAVFGTLLCPTKK